MSLCPTCGAYWRCECPPPPRMPLRHERPVSNRKSRAKYTKGDGLKTLTELVEWISGGGWTYWWAESTRPLHPSWMLSQRLQTLQCLVPRARRALAPSDVTEVGL